MEVVTGATGSVLTKVGALLQEEYIRQKGVQKDVESLQKELLFMRAALYKVAEVPPERLDEQVRAWASNVKELSYDMEDAVDTFNVRVTASKAHGRAWSMEFNKVGRLKARHQLADVIAEMKDLTMHVADLRDRYKLDDINLASTTEQQVRDVQGLLSRRSRLWTWCWQCISYRIHEMWAGWRRDGIGSILASSTPGIIVPRLLAMKDCFGMGDAMKELGPWFVKPGSDHTRVLYVVGDGGAGKTALATALLRKFGHQFDRRAAVTVSSMGSSHDAIREEIRRQLCPNIQNQTCEAALSHLVLIDGIESEEMWKNIERELPCNSTIMVTTRLSAVASFCKEGRGDKKHSMEAVDEKEAKHIFMEALLSGLEDGGTRNSMNNIPARAWEMCRGQPVAMMAMAGYAACNLDKSLDEWKLVCSKLLPEAVKFLGREGVGRVLNHCYHDLSPEIKTCALYLSTYPKGHRISRKHLSRKLIAEGFVGEKPGQSVEEVVDDYVEQLIRRQMIQPVQQSMDGKVEILQVYDLVHDFIVSKASEENLVTVVGGRASLLPPSSSGGKVRRLSHTVHVLPSDDDKTGEGQDFSGNMSHVRSLSVFWGFSFSSTMDARARLPSGALDSPIVQVLDLQGCKDVLLRTKHMGAIYKLFLLKYLGLRRTCISELGTDIGSLKNLETLDVRETHVVEMPDTIWKLQQLVNLLGGDKTARKALRLKLPAKAPRDSRKITMKALRVLSGIEITQELAPHLEHFPNLRKLAIYKVNKDTEIQKLLRQLPARGCLLNLVIIGDDGLPRLFRECGDNIPATSFKLLVALQLSGKLEKLPTWVQQLVALKKLTLPSTVLTSDPILLAKLVDLKDLFSITFSSFDQTPPAADIAYGDEIIVPTGGFAKLKLLRFFAPVVPPLSFLDDAMPSLERIHLRFTRFEGLHGLHNLRMIQQVHLEAHAAADHFTMSMVHNLVHASRHKDFRGPRILGDRYA